MDILQAILIFATAGVFLYFVRKSIIRSLLTHARARVGSKKTPNDEKVRKIRIAIAILFFSLIAISTVYRANQITVLSQSQEIR